MLRSLLLLLLCCLPTAWLAATEPALTWQSVTWNGEPAWASTSQGWRAVVSVTRARLMHFGPAERDLNLLLAPVTRANRNRLGGHRLWLGPQTSWPKFWPPPEAWEYKEPATVASELRSTFWLGRPPSITQASGVAASRPALIMARAIDPRFSTPMSTTRVVPERARAAQSRELRGSSGGTCPETTVNPCEMPR